MDRVFHCAGMTSLRSSDAERLFEVNVIGTRNLLEECLRAEVERVVYTSSVAAIGPAGRAARADENQLFTAGKLGIPYVNSKHEAEVEALRLAAQGLPVVCVNPCVVFGDGDVYGSSTSIVRRFMLGRIPAYVDGGLNIVDVDDVARGHLLADERGVGRASATSSATATTRSTACSRTSAALSGVEPPALQAPAGGGAAARAGARGGARPRRRSRSTRSSRRASGGPTETTKAKRELGWKTSPHEDTIEATVNWYIDREGDRFKRSRRSQPDPVQGSPPPMLGLVQREAGRGS